MGSLAEIFRHLAEHFPGEEDTKNPVLAKLQSRPFDVLDLAHEKLHAYPYHKVPKVWAEFYTEAAIWISVKLFTERSHKWEQKIIEILDTALIMTQGMHRSLMILQILSVLGKEWPKPSYSFLCGETNSSTSCIASKNKAENSMSTLLDSPKDRRKRPRRELVSLDISADYDGVPSSFPGKYEKLQLREGYKVEEIDNPTRAAFKSYLNSTLNGLATPPVIIANHIRDWTAMERWKNPRYLLCKTLGGRRLVPVEIGRNYTDLDWKPEIMPIGSFIKQQMLNEMTPVAYLAQHDLLSQIPELAEDIGKLIYCEEDEPEAEEPEGSGEMSRAVKMDEPEKLYNAQREARNSPVTKNIWLGPAKTVSPLHHDPRNNILVQIFGYKYIRLYSRDDNDCLYPRGVDETGVDMSNTSQVDLDALLCLDEAEGRGVGLRLDGPDHNIPDRIAEARGVFERKFPKFVATRYWECVLKPGQCLFIPRKWWHYVRSLTPSCSVNYWFDMAADEPELTDVR